MCVFVILEKRKIFFVADGTELNIKVFKIHKKTKAHTRVELKKEKITIINHLEPPRNIFLLSSNVE